ncbi:hypothetical protein P691DRAFT_777659 [Macrolepiota fuliginosa MF-IS2]|uniref:F-box domain-containing protein n=1 Tax=Macrolepiota fuliginosa MF-IS2 TaxID=1400762 RepID=A0A9P5X8I6_9AGAR|nr:hypothetical protein P691DRAFT_777659 [Macrolepiota fuliginosa MF-IS2]
MMESPREIQSNSSLSPAATIPLNTRKPEEQVTSIQYDMQDLNVTREEELYHVQSQLPPEILLRIFELALTPIILDERNPRHYWSERSESCRNLYWHVRSLCAVSSYWRGVVHSLPRFWTTMIITIYNQTPVQNWIAMLQLYLKNSGCLPLSLELNLLPRFYHSALDGTSKPTPQHPSFGEDFFEFVGLLNKNAERFETLRLSFPDTWLIEDFPLKKFCNLKSLRLGCPLEPFVEFSGTSYPQPLDLSRTISLQRLTLKNVESSHYIQLVWSNVTALDLWSISIPICIELLLACVNLIEYRCRAVPDEPRGAGLNLLGIDIILNDLQVFEWPFLADWACVSVLQDLHTPSLRHLALGGPFRFSSITPTLNAFFARLPPSVHTLELVSFTSEPRLSYSTIFRSVPNIQRVVFTNCKTNVIEDFMIYRSYLSDPFSRLQKLDIHGKYRGQMDIASCLGIKPTGVEPEAALVPLGWTILKLLHYPEHEWPFGLHVHLSGVPMRYTRRCIEGYQKVVQNGVNFVIRDDHNPGIMRYVSDPNLQLDGNADSLHTFSN